jgi:ribosomal protein S18 acetylase RimI-like enzyme
LIDKMAGAKITGFFIGPIGGRGVMDPFLIRKAQQVDLIALADVAGRAFENDPLMVWLGDTPRQRREIGIEMFYSDWKINYRYAEIYCEDRCGGFAVWQPPDVRNTLRDNFILVTSMMKTTRITLKAWSQVRFFRKIESLHPRKPHYYLSFLGVHPDWQGKGMGSALIQPVLALCDRQRIPAYLETETETNVRFYRSHGFEVSNHIQSSDGAVQVWSMWREPRNHSGD